MLLRCGFCGGTPEIITISTERTSEGKAVSCSSGCEASGPILHSAWAAAGAWNRTMRLIFVLDDRPRISSPRKKGAKR
jgi:hypothetical protein